MNRNWRLRKTILQLPTPTPNLFPQTPHLLNLLDDIGTISWINQNHIANMRCANISAFGMAIGSMLPVHGFGTLCQRNSVSGTLNLFTFRLLIKTYLFKCDLGAFCIVTSVLIAPYNTLLLLLQTTPYDQLVNSESCASDMNFVVDSASLY